MNFTGSIPDQLIKKVQVYIRDAGSSAKAGKRRFIAIWQMVENAGEDVK